MKRHLAVLVAVVTAVVASVTAAVAVTDVDGEWFGHREGLMSSQWHDDRGGRPGGRHQPGSHGAVEMMPGTVPGMQVASEYAYLAEMIAHHEEAVEAAQQLQRSERAEMREFGEAIIASQSAQIVQMQEWLADWYPNRSARVEYQPMMRDLTALSGDRLDQAFLSDMLGHHMGAVMMSQRLLMSGLANHVQVEVLAKTIRDEQHDEIWRMQQWMRAWFATSSQHSGMHGGMHGGT